jgi:hyperosmotically inducible periplasmic protein
MEREPMQRLIIAFIALFLTFGVACTQQRANTPSVKEPVKKALDDANLGDVKVDEDRQKGVVTLSGDVENMQDKQRAEDIARQNAAGMIVANEIGVRPQGAEGEARKVDKNLDEGIKDNFKAALTANKLDNQHIHFDSTNGVLTLTGDVDTPAQRAQAEKIAADIPNVQQVVNKLDIKAGKKRKSAAGQ